MLALYLTGPLTHGDTPVVDVTGDDTLRDLRQKAVCELAIDVDADDIDMVHGECDLSDVSAKICETGLGEGDSVEVRCSRRFEAKTKLEELGVTLSGNDLRAVVLEGSEVAATEEEKECIVQLMLDADPSIVNDCDPTGTTPLWVAARLGYLRIVKLLLNSGADLESCDIGGGTALHGAAMYDQLPVVEELLARGADHTRRES